MIRNIMQKTMITMLIFSALILFSACNESGKVEPESGLTSLRLTFPAGVDVGSPGRRLSTDVSILVDVKVEALDEKGNGMPSYAGKLKFSAKTAFLGRNGWEEFDVQHGDVVRITIVRGMGDLRLLAEDETTLVMGVSDPIYLPMPTFENVQTPTGSIDSSPWRENFILVKNGRMVVTYASTEGFYATDVLGNSYNHLYVYTYNSPYVDRGDVLRYVSGTLSEFFGLTELSFPDYSVDCSYYPLPAPVALTAAMATNDDEMEKHESGLVSVSGVKISMLEDSTYYQYGQWTGRASDGAEYTFVLREGVPGFDPYEFKGQTFERIVGILRQHYAADPEWIIVPRDECDVWGFGTRPEFCDSTPPQTTCTFDSMTQ